jgi:hypothetical protein
MSDKPTILQVKKSSWDADSSKGMDNLPPFQCGHCEHVFRVRKYPDRRKSQLRCPRCQKYLGYVPTEEQSLAAVKRAQANAEKAGPQYGGG